MKFNPYSIQQAPVSLPIWQVILNDLGNPPPKRVARVLGLGLRTIYRYNRTGRAPRAACMALFWLTRWGRSQVYTQAVNDCQAAVGYAEALERENQRLNSELARVLAIGEFGSANDPIQGGEHARLR